MTSAIMVILAMMQSAEPPRTVNDIELGSAEDFTTHGPATVCMRNLLVRARAGETVQLVYSGIHHGSLRLNLSDGSSIEVSHRESILDQRLGHEAPRWEQGGMQFFRVESSEQDVRYQFNVSSSDTQEDSRPQGFISGANLDGSENDRNYMSGLGSENPRTAICDTRYRYGWLVLMGDEPLESQLDNTDHGEEN